METTSRDYGNLNIETPCEQNSVFSSNFIVSKHEKSFIVSHTINPCKNGMTFPLEEIEDKINTLDFVEQCMIHPLTKIGNIGSEEFILLVFTNPFQNIQITKKEEWTQKIQEHISTHFGKAYAVDFIKYYPLLPKLSAGKIDRDWCIHQFNQGLLSRKKRIPIYQTLSCLKKLALEKTGS